MDIELLMSWLQDFYQQIYRNFLADDALQLILGGFQNTLVISNLSFISFSSVMMKV